MEIKELNEEDMKQAIQLKVMCWTEELAGKAENNLIESEVLKYQMDWKNSAEEYNDVRLMIGAFEDNNMLGVAFASFAETFDVKEKGIELNGLWVYKEHRKKGVSLMLLNYIFDFYIKKGMEKIVIYNHHYTESNSFYKKFGAKVIRQEYQMDGKLLIDVFVSDIVPMKKSIENSLKHYVYNN